MVINSKLQNQFISLKDQQRGTDKVYYRYSIQISWKTERQSHSLYLQIRLASNPNRQWSHIGNLTVF